MDFSKFENKFHGQRCFVIGNAPNVLEENISLLKNEKIFVNNRGHKLREHGLDHFDYHVVCDPLVYIDYYKEFQASNEGTKFYPDWFASLPEYGNEEFVPFYLRTHRSHSDWNSRSALPSVGDAWPSSYEQGWGKAGNSVLTSCLIAYFMGYSEIYLLGVEMIYRKGNTHFYKDVSKREDMVPDGHKSKGPRFLSLYDRMFKKRGVKFVNLTRTFPYKDLIQTDSLEKVIKE